MPDRGLCLLSGFSARQAALMGALLLSFVKQPERC
jgi:hypothetical protein